MIQIITGIFLAMHYISDSNLAFINLFHINRDVCMGWMLRYVHINCASFFFIFVYIHISRNIYYSSYLKKGPWFTGIILFLLMMITAFLGYVLPWGQMSFWGATVITNFASAIPYIGKDIVYWIWGGYSINKYTLMRFFSLHYLIPFIISLFVIIHLILLHKYTSSTPIGIGKNHDNIRFHPYFIVKDLLGVLLFFLIVLYIIFYNPNLLNDAENFIKANSLVTPIHIVPEWYFLFAYTILRWVPNKLVGLLLLLCSILILIVIPFIHDSKVKSLSFKPFAKTLFWIFIFNFILLSWLGSRLVEYPYFNISIISSIVYFLLIVGIPIITTEEDKIIFSFLL